MGALYSLGTLNALRTRISLIPLGSLLSWRSAGACAADESLIALRAGWSGKSRKALRACGTWDALQPNAALRPLRACDRISLISLRSWDSLTARLAIGSLAALAPDRPLAALVALRPGDSLRSLQARMAMRAYISLVSLSSLDSEIALVALRACISLIPLVSIASLRPLTTW